MELMDRYIDEVGKHLPEKGRADIQAEIRSALQDMLDDRAAQAGREPDEAMLLEVLQAYGSPEAIAASYQPERYLIGPRLYPAFLKTLRIVLPIVAALGLVGLGVAVAQTPLAAEAIIERIIQEMADLAASVVTALGVVVLVYAVLERTAPNLKEKPAQWDPRSLYQIQPADRVAPGEPITNLVFTLAALVIFNFFRHIIGIYWLADGGAVFLPVLSEAFWGYLPAINLLWVLQIILNAGLVYRGQWSEWTRWLSLAVHGLEIGIAAAMLRGGGLIGLTAAQIAAHGPTALENAELLVTILNQVTRFALVMVIVFGVVSVIKAVLRLLRGRRAPVLVNG